MKVSSLQQIPVQEMNRTNGLRKAAGSAGPPALTEDESRMIRKEFAESKPMTMYDGKGRAEQQMIGSRGRHVDTTV